MTICIQWIIITKLCVADWVYLHELVTYYTYSCVQLCETVFPQHWPVNLYNGCKRCALWGSG